MKDGFEFGSAVRLLQLLDLRTPPFIEWRRVKFLKVEATDPPLRCNGLFVDYSHWQNSRYQLTFLFMLPDQGSPIKFAPISRRSLSSSGELGGYVQNKNAIPDSRHVYSISSVSKSI